MEKLLEEMRMSRMSIDNDQKSYQKARQDIEANKVKSQNYSQHLAAVSKQIRDKEDAQGFRSAESSHLKIKNRVVSESLTKLHEEVSNGWTNLRNTRKKAMELSNRNLKDICNFGLMWNCTELGESNRRTARIKDIDNMRHLKHSLEYELVEFLGKMNRLKDAEQEKVELEKLYANQEEAVKIRENEAYKRLRETDDLVEHLYNQQSKMTKDHEEEENRLQKKLQKSRESISFWERRVSEAQRSLEHQRSQFYTNDANLNGNMFNARFDSDASPSSNKYAKIFQPIRNIPQVSTQNASNTSSYASRVTFQVPSRPNVVRPNQPLPFNSRPNNNNLQINKGNYNSTQNRNVSISSSTMLPGGSNKVFQFKKKSPDSSDKMQMENNCVISGPTSKSVSVTLGTTSFSTFQSGKQVHHYQQNYNDNNG